MQAGLDFAWEWFQINCLAFDDPVVHTLVLMLTTKFTHRSWKGLPYYKILMVLITLKDVYTSVFVNNPFENHCQPKLNQLFKAFLWHKFKVSFNYKVCQSLFFIVHCSKHPSFHTSSKSTQWVKNFTAL